MQAYARQAYVQGQPETPAPALMPIVGTDDDPASDLTSHTFALPECRQAQLSQHTACCVTLTRSLPPLPSAGKALVVHNGLIDLAQVMTHLRGGPLPPTWPEFKAQLAR
jgi:hypothetical protein